jgi:hypothetical protein
MSSQTFTFAVAVNDRSVLENNLLASPCLASPHAHEILVQEGFRSAGHAYNDAIDRSPNDLIVFAHQDMIFPEQWLGQVENALDYLEQNDPNWGVLGCYGETRDRKGRGSVYQSGLGLIGKTIERPVPIQTLDEIVLIFRKSSLLRFDEDLPHFHLYGTDICLRAGQAGRTSYAIPAFCIHNTNQGFLLPKEFYECYWHVKQTWKSHLPIQASCIRITKLNLSMYKRRLQELYYRYVRQQKSQGIRANDVPQLIQQVEMTIRPRVNLGLQRLEY